MVSKKEQEKQELKTFKEVIATRSPVVLAGFIFKYRMKEFLFLVALCLGFYIVASNISCKDGKLEWIPSIRVEVKK